MVLSPDDDDRLESFMSFRRVTDDDSFLHFCLRGRERLEPERFTRNLHSYPQKDKYLLRRTSISFSALGAKSESFYGAWRRCRVPDPSNLTVLTIRSGNQSGSGRSTINYRAWIDCENDIGEDSVPSLCRVVEGP